MLYARAPQKLVGADTENLGKRVQLDIRDRTALSFQKGERGNAQVYAAKLQLRKKLYLFHAARQPKLRHARASRSCVTRAPIRFRVPSSSFRVRMRRPSILYRL